MTFTSFTRTMHRLIEHVKRWSCFVVKLRNSLLLTCGHLIARTLIRLLTALGSDAGTSLPHAITGRGRSATEIDDRDEAIIGQWRKRLDAWVRAQGGQVACRVFHDCVKYADSLAFLTLPYCCEVPNNTFKFRKVV